VTAVATTDRKVRLAARAALDRKAVDLVVLDVRTSTHVASIADAVRVAMKAEARLLHAEGAPESGWVLLDYGDVLVHVFLEDTRVYYALERLWGDAPSVPVER